MFQTRRRYPKKEERKRTRISMSAQRSQLHPLRTGPGWLGAICFYSSAMEQESQMGQNWIRRFVFAIIEDKVTFSSLSYSLVTSNGGSHLLYDGLVLLTSLILHT